MRPTTTRTPLLAALLAAALLAAAPLAPARAAEILHETALGAEVEDAIAAGDVEVWRVSLLAGTELRVRLSASNDDSPDKDGGSGGAVPQVFVIGPGDAELGHADADAADLRLTIGATGSYRVEVRAGAYSGGYELKIDGDPPEPTSDGGKSIVSVAGGSKVVHVEAPAGSVVEVEVRRRAGAPARIDRIDDGLGRELSSFVKSSAASRLRLEALPVPVAGGLDITISAEAGGSGTYEVRTKSRSSSGRPSGGDDHESRRVVVRLASGVDPLDFAAPRGWTYRGNDGDWSVFETPVGREGHESEDADDARGSAGVIQASREDIAALPEGSQANAPAVGSDLGRADVETQTALAAIHASAAHAIASGDGIVVAVLDGGFDPSHEMLAGKVLLGFDFVDGDEDTVDEANGLDDDGDGLVDEGYGHGTFVSSLILATAPGARILPVRVLDSDGRGLSSQIAAGIEWAANHGADVLNLSFGMLGSNETIATAVLFARAKGVTIVAATGNDGRATVVSVPAALPGVIGVTALDALGRRAPFANAGPGAFIAAPGTDLVGAFPGGRYARWSGTSFAAAFVSGGAALVFGESPQMSPPKFATLLAKRARPFARGVTPAQRRALGSGVLDLARLVK